MRILIANDDGVYAPGIVALHQALADYAECVVIAPDADRSGASSSLTLDRPLHPQRLDNGFISINGTPTDCVHLGLNGLLEHIPDMVVSGINLGANLGDDVLYSGTVAAAMEGRRLSLPAIAVSCVEYNAQHYATAAKVTKLLIEYLQKHPLPGDFVLNVNVPDCPFEQLNGFQITRLGHRHRAEAATPAKDPRGRTIWWIGNAGGEADAGPGTDFHAVANKAVSITPVLVDLTRHATLDSMKAWAKSL